MSASDPQPLTGAERSNCLIDVRPSAGDEEHTMFEMFMYVSLFTIHLFFAVCCSGASAGRWSAHTARLTDRRLYRADRTPHQTRLNSSSRSQNPAVVTSFCSPSAYLRLGSASAPDPGAELMHHRDRGDLKVVPNHCYNLILCSSRSCPILVFGLASKVTWVSRLASVRRRD